MKKAILIIICSILILPNLKTETIWAVDISICSTPDELTPTHQSGDFKYFESDGAIAITAYTGTGGDVVIPSAIDGKPVVSIWYLSFPNLSSLTSVTIPNSVTCIGDAVFAGLYGLTSIVVDASNTVYSSQDGVLYNKAKTVLIQYPGGKPGGFTILETVTSVGDWAFLNCHALTSVTIPDSVKNIGQYAFSGCSGFTSVTIPKSVTSIGDAAFYDCQRLTSIVVDASNTVYSSQDGVLYNKAKTVLIQYPGGKPGRFIIPDSVTSIGDAAFADCTDLTSVTIGNSVTSIGSYAFQNCTGLISVTIGNSVKSIGDDAFRNCTALTRAYFLGNAPSMGLRVFYKCARKFTVCYNEGSTGFTSPTWNGYPAKVCENNQCAAEAIYGENSEQTELLRKYRDNVLSKTVEGQDLINSYYKLSPAVTELLKRRPLLKDNARRIIDNMLPGIRKKVQERSK